MSALKGPREHLLPVGARQALQPFVIEVRRRHIRSVVGSGQARSAQYHDMVISNDCRLQIANCRLKAICNLQSAICNLQ